MRLDTGLLIVVAIASAISAGVAAWSFVTLRNRRKLEDELKAEQAEHIKAMELDSCKRIQFVNVQRDSGMGSVVVKFRIKNQSQHEVILKQPVIGFHDYTVTALHPTPEEGIQPGCEYVLEAIMAEHDICGIDPSEFRIVDTGFPNKV